jgi:hypothetical protein
MRASPGRRRLCRFRLYGSIEPKAAPRQRPQDPLLISVVADGPPDGIDSRGNGGFRDDPPAPDRRDDLVPGDEFAVPRDEERKEIEHLRLEPDLLLPAQERVPRSVEEAIGKTVAHDRSNPPRCRIGNRLHDFSRESQGDLQACRRRSRHSPGRYRRSCTMIRLSMTNDPAIRRRPDGSIDTAPYIDRGRALRAEQASAVLRALSGALRSSSETREVDPYPFSRSTLPAR